MAGGGTTAIAAALVGAPPDALRAAFVVLAVSSVAHAALIAGEVLMPAPTSHARLAEREMTRGSYRRFFAVGLLGALAGTVGTWVGWPVVPVALLGLLAYEHAYVQAGQSVPIS